MAKMPKKVIDLMYEGKSCMYDDKGGCLYVIDAEEKIVVEIGLEYMCYYAFDDIKAEFPRE